jgi:uncharacterized iron-regulated membrane protein
MRNPPDQSYCALLLTHPNFAVLAPLKALLALWVAFQSLTGLVLLFDDAVEHRANAALIRHGQGDRGAAEALSVVRQNYPGEEVGVLATPAVSDGVYVVEVGEQEVYVDPAGPRINGTRDHDAGFVAMVRRLHRRFLFDSLLGLPGTWVVGALAVAWLGLSLSGAVTAAADRLARRWGGDPAAVLGLIGVLVVIPVVVLVGTGIRLAVPAGTDRIWAAVTGSGEGRADVPPDGVRITSEDRGAKPQDATSILAALESRYPDGQVARLLMPRPDDRLAPVIAGLSVGFDPGHREHDYGGNTVVFLDQFSADTLWMGRPEALPAARQAALLWSRPLHTGSVAGEPGRLLWAALAVAVAMLAALGWVGALPLAPALATRAGRPGRPRHSRRRKVLARRRRARTVQRTRIARQRRRTSRRLRRRRKVQARTLARMGPRPAGTMPPPAPERHDDVEIDLTDHLEIDLRDGVGVDTDSDVSARHPPA